MEGRVRISYATGKGVSKVRESAHLLLYWKMHYAWLSPPADKVQAVFCSPVKLISDYVHSPPCPTHLCQWFCIPTPRPALQHRQPPCHPVEPGIASGCPHSQGIRVSAHCRGSAHVEGCKSQHTRPCGAGRGGGGEEREYERARGRRGAVGEFGGGGGVWRPW